MVRSDNDIAIQCTIEYKTRDKEHKEEKGLSSHTYSLLTDELNELKALSECNWSCQCTVYIDMKLLRIRLANSLRNPPGVRNLVNRAVARKGPKTVTWYPRTVASQSHCQVALLQWANRCSYRVGLSQPS